MAEIPLYVSHTSVPAGCSRRRCPHRHPGTRLAIGPVPSPWLIRFLQKAHNSNPPDFIPRARPDAISRQRLALFLLAFPGARGGSRTHTPRSGQGILTTRNTFPVDRNQPETDRKSTRLNSSHVAISYAVFCLKKKKKKRKI